MKLIGAGRNTKKVVECDNALRTNNSQKSITYKIDPIRKVARDHNVLEIQLVNIICPTPSWRKENVE